MNEPIYLLYSLQLPSRVVDVEAQVSFDQAANVSFREWMPALFSMTPAGFKGGRRDLVVNWVLGLFPWFTRQGFGYRVAYLVDQTDRVLAQCVVSDASRRFAFMATGDCQIGAVFVPLSERGRGLGRALIETVLRQLRCEGTVWWVCHPENTASIRLAESVGFKLAGRVMRSGAGIPSYREI